MTTHTVKIEEDGTMPLPPEVLQGLDLQLGDKVRFIKDGDNLIVRKWDGQLDLFEDVEKYIATVEEYNG